MIDVIDLFNACLYIQDNLNADLSLVFLARTTGLSRFRFHRVFKAWRGETLHDFVTRMRMERAAFELAYPLPRSSRRSIKAIASTSGYKSLSSFSHAFSAYAQLSPREFRNRALQSRPAGRRDIGSNDALGPYPIAIRNEPAREIAIFDRVTQAGDALAPAGRAALRSSARITGDRYGVELLPNLFVRSRRDRQLSGKAAPMRSVGVDIADWRRSAGLALRGAQQEPRTTILLDAGRYAVIEGGVSIASLYRAWRRGFDEWLAATGESPRSARVYLRFNHADDDQGRSAPTYSVYVPLEEPPAAPGRAGKKNRATRELRLPDACEPIDAASR